MVTIQAPTVQYFVHCALVHSAFLVQRVVHMELVSGFTAFGLASGIHRATADIPDKPKGQGSYTRAFALLPILLTVAHIDQTGDL